MPHPWSSTLAGSGRGVVLVRISSWDNISDRLEMNRAYASAYASSHALIRAQAFLRAIFGAQLSLDLAYALAHVHVSVQAPIQLAKCWKGNLSLKSSNNKNKG